MFNFLQFSKKGLTMVEVLVVITVICLLAAFLIPFLGTLQADARDNERKAELSKMKVGLQVYYTYNDKFPTTTDWISINDDPSFSQILNTTYIDSIPSDPSYPRTDASGEKYSYYYKATTSETYLLCAKSESIGGYICVDHLTNRDPVKLADVDGLSEAALAVGSTGGPSSFTVCGDNITFDYKGSSVVYGTVLNAATGECWMDRNLGALNVATSPGDSGSFGDFFQWGRSDDGHQIPTSGTTSVLSSGDNPGHGNFITLSSAPYDWRTPKNDDLWQGTSAANNNPCPVGWRVPTEEEWTAELATWSSQDMPGAFNSILKLPAAGNRDMKGVVDPDDPGIAGEYWSSTVDGTNAHCFDFNQYGAGIPWTYRVHGFPVRCIYGGSALPVIPTIALNGTAIASPYTEAEADARFASGLEFAVTNAASATVNGGAPASLSGDNLVAVSNADAKTVGSHSYDVVVTSSDGHTASINISYEVTSFASTWVKTFGGSSSEYGQSIQQTSDGGYVLAGMTSSYGSGGSDILVVKLDLDGNRVWAKTFGGSNYDGVDFIQQISGGYILTGSTKSYGAGAGNYDVLVMKLDSDGNRVWAKTFGGSLLDVSRSIQQTSDGGYILTGYTGSYSGSSYYDALIMKLDSSGNRVWAKTFGEFYYEEVYSIQQTLDEGFILAGKTESYGAGDSDVLIMKLDSDGNRVWAKTFGGSGYDQARSIQQTSDGGYVLAGDTGSYGEGEDDVLVMKLDSSGNRVWAKTFGGSSWGDGADFIRQTSDGYIVAGSMTSYGAGNSDAFLMKLDSSGNRVWAKTIGGTSWDQAYSVRQISGGYVMAGYISNYGAGGFDAFASKLDVNGNISNCLICSDIDIAVQTLDISSSEQTADIDLAAQTSDISSSEQTADIDLAKLTLDVVPSEAIVCPGP